MRTGAPGEGVAPELALLGEPFAGEPLVTLPCGVVGVLDGECGQVGLTIFNRGGVESTEFAEKNAKGPAVGDDVVLGEQELVMVLVEADQLGANERAMFEVERGLGLFML